MSIDHGKIMRIGLPPIARITYLRSHRKGNQGDWLGF